MMIFQVNRDTEIAFCPWSAGPLSYLGLMGKEASQGFCQTDKLGTQYSDDNHLNGNDQNIGLSEKMENGI